MCLQNVGTTQSIKSLSCAQWMRLGFDADDQTNYFCGYYAAFLIPLRAFPFSIFRLFSTRSHHNKVGAANVVVVYMRESEYLRKAERFEAMARATSNTDLRTRLFGIALSWRVMAQKSIGADLLQQERSEGALTGVRLGGVA